MMIKLAIAAVLAVSATFALSQTTLLLAFKDAKDVPLANAPRLNERYDLPGCDRPRGFAIDPVERTAYVACQTNPAIVKFDLTTHRIIAKDSVADGVDGVAIDPILHRLYVASESGIVSVFSISPKQFLKLGQGFIAPHAHAVAVDPATHEVYFPLEDGGGGMLLRVAVPR